tara:strand:+ start:566 stop:727 length:162 start_codon:yes stop_codon:yes gene_type:complete
MTDRYSIYIRDECKFSDLFEHEYFDIMEDLAIEFYQTGKPNPADIRTEITKGD